MAQLQMWMEEQKKDLMNAALELIREDAPKNKFSVISGKLKMIEDVESQIVVIKREQKA